MIEKHVNEHSVSFRCPSSQEAQTAFSQRNSSTNGILTINDINFLPSFNPGANLPSVKLEFHSLSIPDKINNDREDFMRMMGGVPACLYSVTDLTTGSRIKDFVVYNVSTPGDVETCFARGYDTYKDGGSYHIYTASNPENLIITCVPKNLPSLDTTAVDQIFHGDPSNQSGKNPAGLKEGSN